MGSLGLVIFLAIFSISLLKLLLTSAPPIYVVFLSGIKRLQCILLKTALCFGVQVYGGVEFKDIVEPESEEDMWRISVKPENHPVGTEGIDVLIGAEGKHVTIPGFRWGKLFSINYQDLLHLLRRKEFRGKLAIAITANFTNKRTTAEAIVDEISGVAFVYKQDFFNTLYEEFGIALENIVYYKVIY